MVGEEVVAQICLWLHATETAGARLEAALAAVPIACVFIDGRQETAVRPLVDLAQKMNVAAVLVDQVALAKRVGADGVHLSGSEAVLDAMASARKSLGDRAIVGAACAGSRHAAMEIGEAGADYVAFGPEDEVVVIDPDIEDDEPEAPLSRAELVGWWTNVFEVPCLAMDMSETDIATAAALGASDFAAWQWPQGLSVADGVARLRELANRLEEREVDA